MFISAAVPSAAGLLIGLFWQPVGIAAPVVFGLLLIGAVRFHAKAGDYANPKTGATRWHPPLTAVAAAITLASLLGGGVKATAQPAAGILPVRGGGGRRLTAAAPALRIR